MRNVQKLLFTYFMTVLPMITILWLLFPAIESSLASRGNPVMEWVNTIAGYLMGGWILIALYFAIRLVVSRKFRENLLLKMTGINERDEREEYIVGKSARNSFLFNLGFLIFLLFINLFFIEVSKIPAELVQDGNEHSLSLGMKFSPIESESTGLPTSEDVVFKYDLPISVSGTLLLLICTQIGSYFFYSRKLQVVSQ